MTRFARNSGSKTTNARVADDPTLWDVLKRTPKTQSEHSEKQIVACSKKESLELDLCNSTKSTSDWADFADGQHKKEFKKSNCKNNTNIRNSIIPGYKNSNIFDKEESNPKVLTKRQKRNLKKKKSPICNLPPNNTKISKNTNLSVIINGVEIEIVKFDGFPIKKEDATRLSKLRKDLLIKGIPKSEVDMTLKMERRKAEKALARMKKKVCFQCRQTGHNLSECPDLEDNQATGICFKCGSTEHTHYECKVNRTDSYVYARCFICHGEGHISRQCPDSPKGLYPEGGSCKLCKDVTHLRKDCPLAIKKAQTSTVTLRTIIDGNLEDLNDNSTLRSANNNPRDNKVINF